MSAKRTRTPKPDPDQVRVTPLEEFRPNQANHRIHDERNRQAIGDSIDQFGPGRSLVAGPGGVIYAGNGTLAEAQARSMEALVVKPRRHQIVVVDRSDLSQVEAVALGIADNRTTDLSHNDDRKLIELLQSLPTESREAAGYSDGELKAFVQTIVKTAEGKAPDPAPADPEPAPPDRYAELVDRWRTGPGQLWTIPSRSVPGCYHKVMCGDSTILADMRRLCAGVRAQIAFTSPPYAEQRKETYGGVPEAKYVEWFNSVQYAVRDALDSHGSFFVNIKAHVDEGERSLYVHDLVSAMKRQWKWRYVDDLVWVHQGFPGALVGRFKNGHEPVFHFANGWPIKHYPERVAKPSDRVPVADETTVKRQGTSGNDYVHTREEGEGMAYPSNVLVIYQGGRGTEGVLHSAAFPLPMPTFFIRAYSDPGDVVLDPFLGAGTTLVAAENEGRICYGMELDHKHLAVTLDRATAVGLEPVLLETVP